MALLRELFWLSAIFNFHLTARHIAGSDNILSDFISRLHEHKYWAQILSSYDLCMDNLLHNMTLSCLLYLQTVNSPSGKK